MSRARVFRSLEEIGPNAPPCAVTIGNFDGVHLGHRHLFDKVIEIGREHGWKPSVLTFDPHPTHVVAPDRAPRLLSTPEQRAFWMGEAGIEQVFLLPFDRRFSELTAGQFIEDVLLRRMNAKAVVVGDNFRFGNKQAGDTRLLQQEGARLGFLTEVVHGISLRGRMVSSTEVRKLILSGDISNAGRMLGHPFAVEGEVVSGFGIGSKQTVPTLNLHTAAEILPPNGVYITYTHDLDDERTWESITNIGYRPTFGGEHLTIETYLLSPFREPTPRRIRVEFLRRVREERKFDTPEQLKQQILRDVARAKAYHRRVEALKVARRAV